MSQVNKLQWATFGESQLLTRVPGSERRTSAADARVNVQNDRQNENPALVPEGDQPSAEERVLQCHYDDLRRVIVHPLGVAIQLVQEGVASSEFRLAVNRQGTTTSQKNVAILDAVWASIHSDPERFEVVMGVLENSTEAVPLVRKMKEQLSELHMFTE